MKPNDPVSGGAARAVAVTYDEPIGGPEGLRKATVKLAHRAREVLGDTPGN